MDIFSVHATRHVVVVENFGEFDSRLRIVLERGLVPLLVASQTVPIIAIAPVVVVGLKSGWFGVAIVATYLTFFPVTIAALRGMRSADPRAFELMRSYAAGRRTILTKLRLPSSPPYLFTAFRIAATASVVGAIVGEFPAGIREGLGGSLLQAMQYYAFSPEDLGPRSDVRPRRHHRIRGGRHR